ncbi:hypothetical protein OHS70_07045 [Streptomyces sp. NBC_00390]|uniref:hypothetical protein n=1 Tax=Streptomyces sp. NBC_00390 TaxID=2975736 RepID=UPI002E1A4088
MSNTHFGEWIDALDRVTEINRAAFDTAARDGRGSVTVLLPWAGAALLVTAELTVLGLRPRPTEFR